MRIPRSFTAASLALTLLGLSAPVHAGTVLLNNLYQPAQTTNASSFVGQSFIAGTVDEPLYGAQMQMGSAPDPGIKLEVESRNFDGTVGATLFSNFSSSYNAMTGLITFTANSAFELTAGTGYWLVLSDPLAGGVTWDFTALNVYQSQYGYELPSHDTSWISTADNGLGSSSYYQPSDGPQLFDLIGPSSATSAIPEPQSFLLLCFPVAIVILRKFALRGRLGEFQENDRETPSA
jgi:hypothetical protein